MYQEARYLNLLYPDARGQAALIRGPLLGAPDSGVYTRVDPDIDRLFVEVSSPGHPSVVSSRSELSRTPKTASEWLDVLHSCITPPSVDPLPRCASSHHRLGVCEHPRLFHDTGRHYIEQLHFGTMRHVSKSMGMPIRRKARKPIWRCKPRT